MVLRHIHTSIFSLEVQQTMFNQSVIEILSTQMSVTGGGLNFKNAIFNSQDRNIEGSSSQIEDQNIFLSFFFIQPVCDSGGGGLIDDTSDVEAGNSSGIFSGLSLRVIEISWDS